ncbi:SDR family NAD(P)-dependent oxidoreductase [Niabella sp. 22666]|jgi:NAD(P)-dependent dehydrogenase (short-subunit alcohol dehydrogenase family)|uniref:SDR family NAD(P)-dependent oxidoreductase n=1 Tax=Niabella sp. 22666 TaxID=3453954 RepID=UPI003F852EDD
MSDKKKKVLVTGASRGIGKQIALELASRGVEVLVHYHLQDQEAADVVGMINSRGGCAKALKADLTDLSQVADLANNAWKLMGAIDYLVNNAGVCYKKSFLEYAMEDFETLVATNFRSTMFLTQFIAQKMISAGIEGSIYSITSVNALKPGHGLSLYGATKGAIETLMKGVALELAPHGIRVNTIALGAIQTDMNKSVWQDRDLLDTVNARIPLGRFGTAQEVGRIVSELILSGDYLTGSSIQIDGGWLLQ